jgi:hypothetical protein
MPIFRQWGLVLSLFAAAALAAPAYAQQPPSTDQSAAPPAATPATPPKPKKHKSATTPATNPPADARTTPPAPASPPPAPPGTATAGVKPTLLGQYGDWGAYTASPGGKKVCFAVAKSSVSETDPPGKSRNPPYLFVSSRPGEKVSNEISVAIGYPFKPASEATVEIGSNSFPLYTQQDGAWIKNAGEEAHLVDVMRSAQNAVVKGMSAKGTHSTDTFSLRGFGQALDRTDQDCK